MQNHKTKYHKETGLEIIELILEVDKKTKKIKKEVHTYKVIVSNDKNYVVENKYGRLEIIEKIHNKYSSQRAVNKVNTGEMKWHSKYLDDYIYSKCISTFSEKITLNRVKKGLYKFIQKETYFYDGLIEIIESQL